MDLNRDGKPDLVGGFGQIHVCLGNGDGTFKPLSPFVAGVTAVTAIAEVNGDGIPDLVAQFNASKFVGSADYVFLGNGDGTFGTDVQSYPAFLGYALPQTFQLAADMNGDGKPDLVLGSSNGSVSVVMNTTPKGFMVSATALSPTAIGAGNSAASTVSVIANFGFDQGVTLSCSSITLNGSPATTAPPACSFNPASVTDGSGTSKLTISTTASSASLAPDSTRSSGLFYAMLFPIIGTVLMGVGFGPRNIKLLRVLLGGLIVSCLMLLASCGGSGGGEGGGAGTPAGTYTITVSGSAGFTVQKATVTLIVQ